MRRLMFAGGLGLGVLFLIGCSDEGPSGPVEPRIEFQITAPAQVESKATIEIAVRIVAAEGVEYPLMVMFEKANSGEGFNVESEIPLFTPEQDRVTLQSPAGRDPRYRITVTESGPAAFSVSRTIGPVDVVDFP